MSEKDTNNSNIDTNWVKDSMIPANIYLLKVNSSNTRKSCETCSKLTIKIPERHHWHCSVVFIVNFKHVSHLVFVFL